MKTLNNKIQVKSTADMVKALKEAGKPFDIDFTSGTRKLYYNGEEYDYFSSNMPPNQLYFINMVKKQIPQQLPDVNKREIVYTHTERIRAMKGKIFNAYEIDLNRAFWNFALSNGFISKDIYEHGLKVNKVVRLAALGSCAKKIYRYHFNGVRFQLKEQPIDNPTENVYFKVAHDCSSVMKKLAMYINEDYLFFWCDAIFFKNEKTKNKVEAYLMKNGLGFKTRKIKIKVLKKYTLVQTKRLISTFDPDSGYKKIDIDEEKRDRPFMHEVDNSEKLMLQNKI